VSSLCYLVYNYCLRKKADFLIFYGFNPIIETILTITAKAFSLSIYREESEYPFLFFNNSRLLSERFITFLYVKIIYKYYAGFLVMTRPIRELLISLGVNEKKIIIINQTVSMNRFRPGVENSGESDYFAFIGSLNQQKDGILTTLDAMSLVLKTHPNVKLKVAGYGSKEDLAIFKEKIVMLNLKKNVEFLGSLNAQKAIALIVNAIGLLSSRPESIQAEYGFPTKIAEYLATANPVITTLTGELRFLLTNNVNAFIVSSNEQADFAERWLSLLNDRENAKRIGKNGQLLAKSNFDPVAQSKKILNFHANGSCVT
jgi:glycosyltransferase involved in cell wall biosynthesis